MPEVAFGAKLSQQGGGLQITEISLSGRHVTLQGSAELPEDFTRIAADYKVSLDDLSVLSDGLAIALKGQVSADGRIEGPLENPKVAGHATLTAVDIDGIGLPKVELDYHLEALAQGPKGKLAASGTSAYGAFDAKIDFALAPDHLERPPRAHRLGCEGAPNDGLGSRPFAV